MYQKSISMTLDTQYRMHPEIGHRTSEMFYGGRLETGLKKSERPAPEGRIPVAKAELPIRYSGN